MSKKHLILPVVACLMLAGCTMGSKTSKKKKKSSSVEVTSKVNPSSQGDTTVSPTSSPTSVAPTSAAPTSNPTSATPSPSSGTSVTPTTSTTIPPVPGGWNDDEAKVFADNFHGIVPPYLSAGLNLTSEEVDDGYYGIWSNSITESAAETYYASVDDSWIEKTAGEGEEAYTYLYKDSTDGAGHAEISIYLDETDDSKFYIGFEWYDDGEVPPVGDSVTISKEDIQEFIPSGTYASAAYSFTTDGVTFNATRYVGLAAANSSGGSYYNEIGLMQLRSHQSQGTAQEGGEITVAAALEAKTITIHWYATYETEAQQYHPVVKVGNSASDISTSVYCNEGTTLTGTLVPDVQEKTYSVYSYTSTYNVSGYQFFMVGAPNSAAYIKDIVIAL